MPSTSLRTSASMRTTLLALAALLVLAGCRRDEAYHERVAKQPQAAAPAAMPPPSMPEGEGQELPPGHPPMGAGEQGGGQMGGGMVGDVPAPPETAPGSALEWTLPKGWTEERTGGIRYATLKPPGEAKVDVSVVVLAGNAGGELANVNRWRGQLGLAPIDEAALGAARKSIATKAGALSLYDLAGDGSKSRMVAGLLSANGQTWFVKMVGESDAVGAAKPDFEKILQTLSFE